MMTAELTIGERLRRARTRGGLSLWDVAKEVGTTANDLSLIERGCKRVDEARVAQIHDAIVDITRDRHEGAVESLAPAGAGS